MWLLGTLLGAMLSHEERKAIAAKLAVPRSGDCRPNKLSAEQRDEICRMWLGGYTGPEIGRRYGVRPQTVAYHVRRAARSANG